MASVRPALRVQRFQSFPRATNYSIRRIEAFTFDGCFFQVFFQVPLVHPWTTMDVCGTDLKLKMRVQIQNNTLCMQGARGSIPLTSTNVLASVCPLLSFVPAAYESRPPSLTHFPRIFSSSQRPTAVSSGSRAFVCAEESHRLQKYA